MKSSKKFNYQNITISGKICTGTTTLGKLLNKELGWEYWDAGSFFRDFCKKCNLSLENTEKRSDNLRRSVDYRVRSRLSTKKRLIHEGWLAGFFAHGIPKVLKVLLICDDSLRVDRLVNRDLITVEEAKKKIKEREKQNQFTWERSYGEEWKNWVGEKNINFFNPKIYDLVIDTRINSREQTLNIALSALLKNV